MKDTIKNIDKDNLVSEFYKEYESKDEKFLLFDLANANENANTKVLKSLLLYNKCQFLNSFLKRLDLPSQNDKAYNKPHITDQKKAIGNKVTGFIDLYIKYNDDIHVIIENKIYGAGDTKRQLARYIATVNGIKQEAFDDWCKQEKSDVKENIHVVYLTADGTKEPTDDSLPTKIKEQINYYAINYRDDILPWLEEDVLPNIPYGSDGMMIAGVRQYIAFLKQLLADEQSDVVNAFVQGSQNKNDKEKYNELIKAARKKYKDVPENVLKSLRKQLEARAEAIFSGDVEGEWVLHFTPSFIILYKNSWAALDTRKYSIPSLYIYAGSTAHFLKYGKLNELKLAVDHLTPTKVNEDFWKDFKFGNHNKNIGFKLNKPGRKCKVNQKESREVFYKRVINSIKGLVDKVDEHIAELRNNKTPITPDVILDSVVKNVVQEMELKQ